MQEIQEDHNSGLMLEGIVVNQFQSRASLPRQLIRELLDEGLPVLPVYLSASVKMKESHQNRRPLVDLAPNHPLTRQFRDLYRLLQDGSREADTSEE